jgi:hypothetical protein
MESHRRGAAEAARLPALIDVWLSAQLSTFIKKDANCEKILSLRTSA